MCCVEAFKVPTIKRSVNRNKAYADRFGNRCKGGIVVDERHLRETLRNKSSLGDHGSTIWVNFVFKHPSVTYGFPSLWQHLIHINPHALQHPQLLLLNSLPLI